MRPTLIFVLGLFVALLSSATAQARNWTHWHGDSANTGYMPVRTEPALNPTVRTLGPVAPGSGPVIGEDGTIYIGLERGQLVALNRDLTERWRRITKGNILASPVIGADGQVYVLSVQTIRRVQRGRATRFTYTPRLEIFTGGGALLYVHDLPAGPDGTQGYTNSPLNIWRGANGDEAVMFSMRYNWAGGYNVNLLAVNVRGAASGVRSHKVTYVPSVVTGGVDWRYNCDSPIAVCSDYRPAEGSMLSPADAKPPMPGVAMYSAGGSDPLVIFADNYQNIWGFSFSPNTGFRESFRRHVTNNESNFFMTTPIMLGSHAVVRAFTGPEYNGQFPNERRAKGWLLYAGPSHVSLPDYELDGLEGGAGSSAAITGDGRVVSSTLRGLRGMGAAHVVRGATREGFLATGESAVPPAVSANHIFISAVQKFWTFDAKTLSPVASFPWSGGGASPPAISSDGYVYAMAGRALYVFPPRPCVGRRCQRDQVRPNQPVAPPVVILR